MVVIRACSVSEIAASPSLEQLLAGYGAESAIPELGPPKADIATYRKMESLGSMKAIGVFAPHLVGLAAIILYGLPHFDSRKVASMESFYVMPAYRPGANGLKLLTAAEECAAANKAHAMLVCAPIGKRLEKILPRRGYRATNTVFMKALT